MKEYPIKTTTTEIQPVSITISNLQSGETVSSATATHTPPSGDALTITPSVSSPTVTLLLGPFAVVGNHIVKVQAVGDNGSKPEVIFNIQVVDL